MKPTMDFKRGKIPALGLLLLALAVGMFRPAPAWSQPRDPIASLQTFNRAALSGDLDAVQKLLSRRFLLTTFFVEQKRSNPGQLREEVRLLSFYQALTQERMGGSAVRVKVVQEKLVGRQGFVTRWYYLVKEESLWKLDKIGEEEPY